MFSAGDVRQAGSLIVGVTAFGVEGGHISGAPSAIGSRGGDHVGDATLAFSLRIGDAIDWDIANLRFMLALRVDLDSNASSHLLKMMIRLLTANSNTLASFSL